MSSRPNVLLVMTDQQRFDTIKELGNSNFDVETPNMDFLAREGIVFENCFCTAPICSPSRSSILSGLYPSQAGMPGNLYAPCPPLSTTMPTIANFLRGRGYECNYHGKWHLGGDVKDYGFEHGEETTHDETARQLASRMWRDRDWIMNERPFFHMVSFINPHDHYFYDPAHRVEKFERPWKNLHKDPNSVPDPAGKKMVDWPEEKWGSYHEYYCEQMERVDKDLGELLHQFRTGGFYNNSWIIFTTDHGDMAGEQNLAFKGSYMYEGVVRVPLIIVPPMTRFLGADRANLFQHDLKPGRCDTLCSLIDLLPTICDITDTPIPENLPGKSLLPYIKGEKTEDNHDAVFAEWHTPAIRMIRTRTHKYVLYLNEGEELYDLEKDPHEITNQASNPEFAEIKFALSKRLHQHMEETQDPFYQLDKQEFVFNPSPNHMIATLTHTDTTQK